MRLADFTRPAARQQQQQQQQQQRRSAVPALLRTGALSLRDLAEPPPSVEPPPPPPPPPPDPALLEAAWQRGFSDGHAEGHRAGLEEEARSRQARTAEALEHIALALSGAEAAARALAEEQAEALAGLMAAMLDATLPEAAPRLCPTLIARCAAALRPALQGRPGLRLLVAPDILSEVSALLPDPVWNIAAEPGLPPGDARIEWRGGAVVIDLAARRAAVRAALGELGLLQEETVA
jgi:flagellar biosynthesis/type III secretory pathway protein FliH